MNVTIKRPQAGRIPPRIPPPQVTPIRTRTRGTPISKSVLNSRATAKPRTAPYPGRLRMITPTGTPPFRSLRH
jgi:hypothetical protein